MDFVFLLAGLGFLIATLCSMVACSTDDCPGFIPVFLFCLVIICCFGSYKFSTYPPPIVTVQSSIVVSSGTIKAGSALFLVKEPTLVVNETYKYPWRVASLKAVKCYVNGETVFENIMMD